MARSVLAAAMASSLPLHGAAAQETQAVDAVSDFDLPAGELATALEALGSQGSVRIDYWPELVADKRGSAVSGRMGWQDALDWLLQGTGLAYRQTGDAAAVIEASTALPGPSAHTDPETTVPHEAATATDLSQITVTGTRIRGGTTPSPVITIGSERIREEGLTDLGEVIRSVPQNFSGGQNPGVLMGNVAGGGLANQNVTGGSGLNLRGLGPDASVTLLNGRRMAYGGLVQAVDISAIPMEAVERIDIVPDGASALYGSDAVGGVANVILKRDFEGLALRMRHGTASSGGLTTREYTATTGATWVGGGVIATYNDVSVDPIHARQRSYTSHLPEPSTIYPGSKLRSGLFSVHQALGDLAELRLDALRTEREQTYFFYFSVPTRYNILSPDSAVSFVSPSIDFFLPGDWVMSLGGAWGRDDTIEDHARVDLATGVRSTLVNTCFCNISRTYEVGAEGPVFSMSGGDARLAVGAGYRKNEFLWHNYVTGTFNARGEEASRFAYAEFNLPLVGPDSRASGTRRLDLSAAVRREDYDSFGAVTTPKIGLVYGPTADLTFKASWGESFKAPTLLQHNMGMTALLRLPAAYGGTGHAPDETVLFLAGGNPGLEPEWADSWTAAVAFHPERLPGLEAELTGFVIDYTDRVVQPIGTSAIALSNPNYAEFVERSPGRERQAELLAGAAAFSNGTAFAYDPDKVVAIIDGRFVNATRQRIKGVDLSGSYRFGLGQGSLTVRGSASWLDSDQQTKGTPAPYDLAGTLHNPAKFSSRIGAVWSRARLSASLFGNHVSGVTNVRDGSRGGSFSTVDAAVRYSTDDRDVRTGFEFSVTANNLLGRTPPLYTPVQQAYVAPTTRRTIRQSAAS